MKAREHGGDNQARIEGVVHGGGDAMPPLQGSDVSGIEPATGVVGFRVSSLTGLKIRKRRFRDPGLTPWAFVCRAYGPQVQRKAHPREAGAWSFPPTLAKTASMGHPKGTAALRREFNAA